MTAGVVTVSAQYIYRVHGIVTDAETSEELIGVSVVCKTCNANHLPVQTLTDLDGYYQLVGYNHWGHVLEFSYIGYETQLVNVTRWELNVALTPIE